MKKISSLLSLLAVSMASTVFAQGTVPNFVVQSSGTGWITLSQATDDTEESGKYDCSSEEFNTGAVNWYSAKTCIEYALSSAGGTDVVLELGSDLDFKGHNVAATSCVVDFTPIDESLSGQLTFDGQGYTISNLCYIGGVSMKDGGAPRAGVGFFSEVSDVVVKNVTFDGAYISVQDDSYSEYANAGVVVGYASDASFESVTVSNSSVTAVVAGAVAGYIYTRGHGSEESSVKQVFVSGSTIAGSSMAGGLYGHVYLQGDDITLGGASVQGTSITGSEVGGFAGVVDGSNTLTLKDKNFTMTGSTVSAIASGMAAGGFVGRFENAYSDRLSGAAIKIQSSAVKQLNSSATAAVGGVVGLLINPSGYSSCFDGASVEATLQGGTRVGGFAGDMVHNTTLNYNYFYLRNFSFNGTIGASCSATPALGGVFGYYLGSSYHSLTVLDANIYGDISFKAGDCDASPEIASVEIGGFFGHLDASFSVTLETGISNGNLSTDVKPTDTFLGYVAGYSENGLTRVYMRHTIHYGNADGSVESGVGNVVAADWNTSSTCSDNYRNAVGSLQSQGDFEFYYGLSKDGVRLSNGVISADIMGSNAFVAHMNTYEGSYGDWTVASGVNNGVPFDATGSYKPVHFVRFVFPSTYDASIGEYVPVEPENFEELKASYTVLTNPSSVLSGYVAYAFTDHAGKMDASDVEFFKGYESETDFWQNVNYDLKESSVYSSVASYSLVSEYSVPIKYYLCVDDAGKYSCNEGGLREIESSNGDIEGYSSYFVSKKETAFTNKGAGKSFPILFVSPDGEAPYLVGKPSLIYFDSKTDGGSPQNIHTSNPYYARPLSFNQINSDFVYVDANAYDVSVMNVVYFTRSTMSASFEIAATAGINKDAVNPSDAEVSMNVYVDGYKYNVSDGALNDEPATTTLFNSASSATLASEYEVRLDQQGIRLVSYDVEFKPKSGSAEEKKGLVNERGVYFVGFKSFYEGSKWSVSNVPAETKIVMDSVIMGMAYRESDPEDYVLKVTPTFEYIPYTVSFDVSGEDRRDLFFGRDLSQDNAYDIGGSKAFPVVAKPYYSMKGWRLDGTDDNSSGYTRFDATFLSDASAGNYIDEENGNKITLYPAWNDWSYWNMTDFCIKKDGGSTCYENYDDERYIRVNLALSQSVPGDDVPYTHELNGVGISFIDKNTDAVFVFDVDMVAKAGYVLKDYDFSPNTLTRASGFAGAGETDIVWGLSSDKKTLTINPYAMDTPYMFSYEVEALNYDVSFDITKTTNRIYINKDYVWKKTVSPEDRYYPGVYALVPRTPSDPDGPDKFNVVMWSPLSDRSLDEVGDTYKSEHAFVSSRLIDSSMTMGDYESVQAGGVEGRFTVFAAEAAPTCASSTVMEVSEVVAYGVDDNDNLVGEAGTHGHLVLSQSYDDGAGHTWSREYPHDYEDLLEIDGYQDVFAHGFMIPRAKDYLTFKLSTAPDAGYSMQIKSVEPMNTTSSVEGVTPMTYVAADSLLTVYPDESGTITVKVSYKLNDYTVGFTYPKSTLSEHEFFVFGEFFTADWPYEARRYSVNDNLLPQIGSADGCVAWSVDATLGENTVMSSVLDGALAATLSTSETNTLNPLIETTCKKVGNDVEYTLNTDGNGTLELLQIFQTGVDDDGDDVFDTIVHNFTAAQGSSVLKMKIPFVPDPADETKPMAAKVILRAVPESGYMVDKISYQSIINGKMSTVMLDDDAVDDVVADFARTYSVSFKEVGPFYVTYDLNVSDDEKSTVFLPIDAKSEESLTYDVQEGEIYLWEPVRVDACFQGWSIAPKGTVTYKTFDADMMSNLSSNEDFPTILYAVWDGAGDGVLNNSCDYRLSLPIKFETTVLPEQATMRIYQVWNDEKIYHDFTDGPVSIPLQAVAGNDDIHYSIGVEYVAQPGYVVENPVLTKVCDYENAYCHSGEIPAEDGVYVVHREFSTGSDRFHYYELSADVESASINVAFASAEEGTFKLDNYTSIEQNVELNAALPVSLARADACFNGWNFSSDANSGFTTATPAFFAEAAKAQPVELRLDEQNTVEGYVLNPVWNENCTPSVVKVVSKNPAEDGKFALTQDEKNIDVGVSEVDVPANVTLNVGFTYGTSVKQSENTKILIKALAADGSVLNGSGAGEEFALSTGTLSYQFKNIIEVAETETPVVSYELSINTSYDDMQVVFDKNSGTSTVFYGDEWKSVETYNLGMTAEKRILPVIYRTDAVLKGWTLSKDADASVYTVFGDSLTYYYTEASKKLAEGESVHLYAKWDESVKPATYTVLNGSTQKGSLALVRSVDGVDEPYNAGDAGLKIPVDAALNFQVSYTLGSGYAGAGLQLYDLMGNKVGDAFESGDEITVSGNVIVMSLAASTPYTLAFDVNAAGCESLFYGKSWVSEAGYDLDANNVLPTNVYCADKILAGWKLSHEDGTAPHTLFDEDVHYSADTASTNGNSLELTAVWKTPDEAVETVTIKSANLAEGTMSVAQMVNGDIANPVEVGSAGVVVPVGNGDVELLVSFDYGTGYAKADGFFTAVNDDKVSSALNYSDDYAKLTVSENVTVSAPVKKVEYSFAFNPNAGEGVQVFYGAGWVTSKNMKLADRFPENVYINDACFAGWALQEDATEGYVTLGQDLLAEIEVADAEIPLYAVWNTATCSQKSVTLKVANAETLKGDFEMVLNGETYVVGATGLKVPAVKGLDLKAVYEVADGYSWNSSDNVYYEENGDRISLNEDVLSVVPGMGGTEIALNIPAEKDPAMTLVFNVNANGDNVFYGSSWRWSGEFIVGGEDLTFPEEVYRVNKTFKGWALSATGKDAFSKFDEQFIGAVKSAQALGMTVDTLYAVWENSTATPVEVSFVLEFAESGSLNLTQTVADSVISYSLASGEKLAMPKIANGLAFNVNFVVDVTKGYELQGDKPILFLDAMGVAADSVENESEIVVDKNMILSANVGAFEVVFNSYTADGTVMFGSSWKNNTQSLSVKDASGVTAFPMDLYRDDACLVGWTLVQDPSATDASFTEFNADFVKAARETYKDRYNGVLYAKWNKSCTPETFKVTMDKENAAAGYMELVQYGENNADGDPIELFRSRLVSADEELMVAKDASFKIEFTPYEGYSKDDSYAVLVYNASGRLVTSVAEGESYRFTSATRLKAQVSADAYSIAFNINADDKKVFYNDLWVVASKYSMSMASDSMTFPKAYRADACHEGWSLEPVTEEMASDAQKIYTFGDNALLNALKESGKNEVTLYAVWDKSCEQNTVAVKNTTSEKGDIFLKWNANGKTDSIKVDGEILLPMESLNFAVAYTVNPGYSAVSGTPVSVLNSDGIEEPLPNNMLVLGDQEEISFAIPAEKDDAFSVVFVENTTDRVFYGSDWVRTDEFAVGSSDNGFPAQLYRTDATFLGWAFSSRGTKRYHQFDDEFVAALKAQKDLGNSVDTLFAIWNNVGSFENHKVSLAEGEKGSFFIYQVVEGIPGAPIQVGAAGVDIPMSEEGLRFFVNYEAAPGYTVEENGYDTEIMVMENMDLQANVRPNTYMIALNVNADSSENVFYGENWKREGDYNVSDRVMFADEIYQSDKKLLGWSLNKDGSGEKFESMTGELAAELELGKVNTLYAVWEKAEVETYTVTFANGEVGDLKLAQVVENDTIEFVVGADGLDIPKAGNFQFLVAFKAASGYVYDELKDNLIVSDAAGDSSVIKDDRLVVENDVTISIPLVAASYPVVFNVNSDRKDVIYGDDWISGKEYAAEGDKVQKLPQTIYAADACVVGWAVGSDTTLYAEFGPDLIDALNKSEKGEQGYVLNAKWKNADACVAGGLMTKYERLTLNAKNGSVEFLEAREGNDAQFTVAHTFAGDNTMLLPENFDGSRLTVHSTADSSYVLDYLVMTRVNDANDIRNFEEGRSLVKDLSGAVFTTNFVKSNKTELAVVLDSMELAGNAMRISFSTSAFEVTRDVKARVYVMDASANMVADTLFDEPLKETPAAYEWMHFPFDAGEYSVVVELFDSVDTVFADTSFAVKTEIAVVADGGWQMISMAAVDTAALIWDDDPAFYWWDEQDKAGEFWQYKAFVQGDEIVAERGYWYSSLEGRALPLNPAVKPILDDVTWTLDSVHSGWNLVANPYGWNLNLYNDNREKLCASDEVCDVEFYTYNAETGDYDPAVELKPFEAVWAKVGKNTGWNLKAVPSFGSDVARDNPEIVEVDSASGVATKRRTLAKANAINSWSMQAILSDNRGKKDSWNVLGVSSRPFVSEEPPEAQGNHVNLSLKEGKKSLAKSFKPVADSYEWELALRASSERMGNLTLVGVAGLRSLGYHVFVTVDGKTVEMTEGESVRVALKTRETIATVRVTAGSLNVVAGMLDGLNMSQTPGKVHVGFNVDESLAGSRTVVDIVNLDGKVLATFGSKAQAGRNLLTMDAPRSGLYMLRVRVASQQIAGKIMVK